MNSGILMVSFTWSAVTTSCKCVNASYIIYMALKYFYISYLRVMKDGEGHLLFRLKIQMINNPLCELRGAWGRGGFNFKAKSLNSDGYKLRAPQTRAVLKK